eukprot:g15538.t1
MLGCKRLNRSTCQVGAGLWGICTFQLALTSSFTTIIALRVLNGAALAMIVPVVQSMVADLTNVTNCGSAFGKVSCAHSVGQVMACLMVTPISEMWLHGMRGWRLSLGAFGLLSLLTIPFLRIMVYEEPRVWNPRRFGIMRELRTMWQRREVTEPEPVPAPAPVSVVPRSTWRRRRCLNSYCTYLAHQQLSEFEGYCCKACHKWEKDSWFWKRCQSVTEGVDASARQVHVQKPGKIHGDNLVIVPSNNGEALRMQVQEEQNLWITIAERNARWETEVTSPFHAPRNEWGATFASAKILEEDWRHADDQLQLVSICFNNINIACDCLGDFAQVANRLLRVRADKKYAVFEEIQTHLRDALHDGVYETKKEDLDAAAFEEHAATARRNTYNWHGGRRRIDAVQLARQRMEQLEEGNKLNMDLEMKVLAEQHFKVVVYRNKMRSADTEWLNQRDLGQAPGEAEEDLRRTRDRHRAQEKAETRIYFEKMARLCALAHQLAPEMLPELRKHTDKSLETSLRKLILGRLELLDLPKGIEVLKVLDHNISISHYDPEQLSQATPLSGSGARHAVYEMRYEGSPCVVKVFDLHTHRGLPGFIQEVMLHVRLRHPLVVPLRRAFIDHKDGQAMEHQEGSEEAGWLNREPCEHRGFLQFDRYDCNLGEHLSRISRPQRVPHRFGEPATVGVVDQMPRRIAHLMIQSIAHVHSHGIVHGDLKPSNWLYDGKNKVPILCDFETARDHDVGVTVTSKIQSQGFQAPELQDPSARPTLESDVFALGRSIQNVLSCVPESRPSEKSELHSFVSKMVCQNPMERIAAKDAAQDSWQREELCTMVKAFSREQACSVEKVRSGIASRMFGKPKCKLNIIAVKAWWQEMLSCTSDGYEHIVRADEVLYTQAECSPHFKDKRSLQQLIDAIMKDPEYPLKDDRLIIDVVKKGSALLSVDNRRLYCFHQAQRQLRNTTVWIKIREHPHSMVQERFVRHFETTNGGKSILVRMPKMWTGDWQPGQNLR